MIIHEKVSLGPISTFRIGGQAKYFSELKTREELDEAFSFAESKKIPVMFFSGASNILVADGLINALVLRLHNTEISVQDMRVKCGAGASLSKVVVTASNDSLSGLEWAIGIPGSIGGAVRGNAGAFGQSIEKVVETVTAYNIKKRKFEIFSHKDCSFSYRNSFFKESSNYIIWEIVLKLEKQKRADIEKQMNDYLDHRISTQPKLPSAGCIFKNFKLDELREQNLRLAELAERDGKAKGGMVPAGWIIEMAGLSGMKKGDAKVSLEHCNFIVNTRTASATEVRSLIDFIKKSVMDRFAVQLEEELQYFGF